MNSLITLQGSTGREQEVNGNHYKNIPIFADIKLHETCFNEIKDVVKNARILVLGSGGGAFDQRLVDHGFTHVTSLDFRPDFFRAKGTVFINKDLNLPFSDLGIYDVIIAIELIEHLENPAHFLRNAAACLAANGKLLVTTPNIESGPSRVSFLVQGTLSFFTKADMDGSGHITLLPQHIFAFHTESAGLHIEKHTYNRDAWMARLTSNIREFFSSLTHLHIIRAVAVTLKTFALVILSPLTLLHRTNGNIHIYVLRKS